MLSATLQAQADAIAAHYEPPHIGRPSDIDKPGLVQEFLALIADGNYIETAAQACGIAKQTLYNWKKRGEDREEPYASFVDAWKRAEARAEVEIAGKVRKAADLPQFWAAGMTYLERRHPERWGRRTDEGNAPKVQVFIGGQASDVQVQISSSPVNVIANYQTHSPSEAVTAQALPALVPSPFAPESQERKPDSPAKADRNWEAVISAPPSDTPSRSTPRRAVRRRPPVSRAAVARRNLSGQIASGLAEPKKEQS